MTSKTDAEGRTTTGFEIDPCERRFAVGHGRRDATSRRFDYFPNGDLRTTEGPRPGQLTSFIYDLFGNPATTTDAEGNVTTTVYDERSRLTSSSDTFGRRMSQDFDELDRVTRVTRTDDKEARRTPRSSSATTTPAASSFRSGTVWVTRRSFTLDGLNRVVETRDDLGPHDVDAVRPEQQRRRANVTAAV